MTLIRNHRPARCDLRHSLDERKILLINLSKGRIGEINTALLGALFITNPQLSPMTRLDVADSKRPDFFLYVDEFQDFATDSFTNILYETRKYRLIPVAQPPRRSACCPAGGTHPLIVGVQRRRKSCGESISDGYGSNTGS